MKKVLPYIIVLLLIIGLGAGICLGLLAGKYSPTKEKMDYAAAIGLNEGEYAITFNQELLEDRAVDIDGRIYLDIDFASKRINSRCYWDANEQLFLYMMPTELLMFQPDQTEYTIRSWSDEKKDSFDYAVIRQLNDKFYIAVDFVVARTQIEYAAFEDPNRVVFKTKWGEETHITLKKDTVLRYKGGIKSEILREAPADEEMILLEAYDDWMNVATSDGYIGWVERKAVNEQKTVTTEAPDFEEPVFSSIHKDYKINLGWHQVMSQIANESLTQVLQSTKGINTLSPTWFSFDNTSGDIRCIATQDYVDMCHANGLEVWALFSNEFPDDSGTRYFDTAKTDEVLSFTSKRTKVIKQMISYVKEYDIDGINIDFESISSDGADDYVQFIRELSIACRANQIVLSVDNYVPKYTYYYNRREQGKVVDYVVIMGYDETTAGADQAGPVASLGFVDEGIRDTLAVVDASKVINGIPFYTRVWCTTPEGEVSSFACGMDEALSYLTNHSVTPQYLEEVGLNYGSYTSTVDGNFYEIWLQDQKAIEEEMKLIQQYDLAGVASWKIGFESGMEIWDVIQSYLQ